MSHLSLDARAILEYLNELGYRNISGEQLKEFMKDLRKLIKYEERLGIKLNQPDYFHSLCQRTTSSFRAKIDKENATAKRNSKDANVKQTENSTTTGAHKRTSTVVQKTRKVLGEQNQLTASADKPSIENQHKPRSSYKNNQTTTTISSTTYKDILINDEKYTEKQPLNKEKNITSKSTSRDFWNAEQRSTNYKETKTEHRDNRKKLPPGERNTDTAVQKANRNDGARKETRSGTFTNPDEKGDVVSKLGITRKLRNSVNLPEWEPDQQFTTRSRTKPISETGTMGGYSAGGGTAIPQIRSRTRNDRSGVHDPVKLYHYYQREWKRFSDQIPSGDNRAELRWQIRQMCLDPE